MDVLPLLRHVVVFKTFKIGRRGSARKPRLETTSKVNGKFGINFSLQESLPNVFEQLNGSPCQ
jgi:hypothetical protein